MAIKVCHFTSTHNPKDQRIFYKECISLAKDGYEVYLVEQGDSELADNVHIVGTHETNKGRYYRLLIRPYKVYRIAKNLDADIYQFHDMELLPYGYMLKLSGKKVIFDCHEDYATRFADSDALPLPVFIKEILKKIYILFEKFICSRLDALIGVSPGLCRRLRKINSRTYMVTNYPIINLNDKSLSNPKRKISNYVAYWGQVSDTYCLAHITSALQGVKNIEFHICGPERLNNDLELIKERDNNGIVKYFGCLPYNKVQEFAMSAISSFLIIHYGNNVGGKEGTLGNNKLFESMKFGVPVICTDFILWQNIIEKYKCGICVNPYSEEEIRNAVNYLIDNPEAAKEMGLNGQKAVQQEYNWTTQEKILLDLYKELR